MSKKAIFIPILLLAVLVLVGAGCGEKETGEGGVPSGGEGETGSLTEVLGKAAGISSLKYDMVSTAPDGGAVTTRMWWKGNKIRMEGTFDGKNMVYLTDMDRQVAYMYFPAENTAMELSLDEAQGVTGEPLTEQSESIAQYNPVILGTEVLDGKRCLVTEYTAGTVKTKSWVWTDYGLIIRVETTTNEGVSVVELKNIDFSTIPDNTFELPAGVQLMEIPFSF